MSEKSMFFNSVDGDTREYSAADFADCLSGICPNRVLEGLAVSPTNSQVNISAGKAIINGYIYVLDETKIITPSASSGNSVRYGRVVLQLDLSSRSISAAVKTNVGSAPALEENEISLAIVPVQVNGAVTGVTDDRTFSNSYSVLKNKPIHYGTGTPSNSLGNNGDIYVQYES